MGSAFEVPLKRGKAPFCVRDRSPKGREGSRLPALGPLGGKITA